MKTSENISSYACMPYFVIDQPGYIQNYSYNRVGNAPVYMMNEMGGLLLQLDPCSKVTLIFSTIAKSI